MHLIKEIARFMFWYPLRWLLPPMPLRVVYFLGAMSGIISSKLFRNYRNVLYQELSLIFKDKTEREKRYIIKQAFMIMHKNLLEVLMFAHLTKEKIHHMIQIEGKERLDDALAQQKGVILLIAHFGHNKLIMPALGFRSYKINQVGGKPTEWKRILGSELTPLARKILDLELNLEQKLPANFIYVFKSMRPVFEYLKRNEIVCMAIDGGGGTKRVRVPFLGREALISPGPFRIAQKTDAIILPAFMIRKKDNTHKMIIEAPIELETRFDEEENDVINTQKFMDLLARYVKRYPCHYIPKLMKAKKHYEKDPIPLFRDYENY